MDVTTKGLRFVGRVLRVVSAPPGHSALDVTIRLRSVGAEQAVALAGLVDHPVVVSIFEWRSILFGDGAGL
jgi:hypothetical protein